MTWTMAAAVVIIAVAIYFLVKGFDVRLVLFTAGLALCSIALDPLRLFDAFLAAMVDKSWVGPICTAMAFASVLSAAGCDREMVRLLMKPLRKVKWALIPGGCVVGFLTNSAITSQTGAAAAVGPILVPLLMAAGFPPAVAGACLVLGCSGGGNLLNMAEPDFVAIKDSTGVAADRVLRSMVFPEVASFAVAVAVFTFVFRRRKSEQPFDPAQGRPAGEVEAAPADDEQPIDLVKALLPPLPVVLLFVLLPRWNLWPWLSARYPGGLPISHAMIFCTILAFLINRKEISAQARTFFDGMGKAYANIISLIITGRCFIEGVTAVGMIKSLVSIVSGQGFWGRLATESFPWAMAVLSGSGIAPCVSFCQAVLPEVAKTDQNGALNLGVLAAVASNFGRTMSPVAAVVMFSSTLVKVSPIEIVKRTGPPLLIGGVVLFIIISLR
ncbi:MAG: C4-dicarboxylate transporter [Planctomycetota bacterium]|nr:MAG: C4-dicarboxylate transporter [Planctomycetota bacterium]